MLIVDYLGLIRSTGKSLYESTSRVSKELAVMAKSLNKPVVCLCQLNREAEVKIPTLNTLRDSGAIEQDADCVWLLHRHREGKEATLIIAKARQAECGEIPLAFDPERCSFSDVTPGVDEVPEWK